MTTNKLNALAMILGLASVISLSSCLGDDNDNNQQTYRELTQLEKQIALSNAEGEYEGYFYFINTELKMDSLETVATISSIDSVMTVTIPTAGLRPRLQFLGISEDKLAIFDKSPSIKLKGVLHPYYNQYMNAGDYTFSYTYVNKTVDETFTVDDADHTIEYKFPDYIRLDNYSYYNCLAEYYNKYFRCNILFDTITLDGMTYTINTCMNFEGKKK